MPVALIVLDFYIVSNNLSIILKFYSLELLHLFLNILIILLYYHHWHHQHFGF